jgi:hypothetical protein
LRATGRSVYPINPMAVARYRDRRSVAGRKSDHADAVVLANSLRTDLQAHRPLPAGSELAQAIAVLASAQQDAVWERTCAHNKLRSHLREYFPGFLAAFAEARGGIMRPQARVILAAAPDPATATATATATRLTLAELRALLRKTGRSRSIDAEAARLREAFRAVQMRQPPLVEEAMDRQALALLRHLEQAAIASFNQHPDAGDHHQLPRARPAHRRPGARRDRRWPAPVRRRQGVEGLRRAAPVTRARGKTLAILHRRVKNQRLAAAGYIWAFAALTASPGAGAHYDRRKAAGDRRAAAQRNLFGRLLGCLHHCLATGQPYKEATTFPAPSEEKRSEAA